MGYAKMKYKGLKPINENVQPRGIYTKTARKIFEEFLNSPQEKAVADIEGTEKDLKSLYNAMKSLLRRDNKLRGKIDVSINNQTKQIILWKL